jgi:hypothetical protein
MRIAFSILLLFNPKSKLENPKFIGSPYPRVPARLVGT